MDRMMRNRPITLRHLFVELSLNVANASDGVQSPALLESTASRVRLRRFEQDGPTKC
jgi:hypothetical protein